MRGATNQKSRMRAWFFEAQKQRFNRCLAPGMNCENDAIKAHSIQNSQTMDLLAHDGHVKQIVRKIERKGDDEPRPVLDFQNVGRNQATTFEGFCAEHDAEIFKPIDTKPFSAADAEQLFLFAYRAIARELLVLMDAAIKFQSGYEQRIKVGWDSADEPTPAGMAALDYMVRSHKTFAYKLRYEEAMLARRYGDVVHDVVSLSHAEPTIAVSSLFSVDDILRDDGDWVKVALTILPLSQNESVAVFSYLPDDAALARPRLNAVLSGEGHYRKYALSKLVLNNCENFVISPAYFDTWTPAKKEAVTDYFIHTLATGDLAHESEHLYLFG